MVSSWSYARSFLAARRYQDLPPGKLPLSLVNSQGHPAGALTQDDTSQLRQADGEATTLQEAPFHATERDMTVGGMQDADTSALLAGHSSNKGKIVEAGPQKYFPLFVTPALPRDIGVLCCDPVMTYIRLQGASLASPGLCQDCLHLHTC